MQLEGLHPNNVGHCLNGHDKSLKRDKTVCRRIKPLGHLPTDRHFHVNWAWIAC
jgi:hypothetical protein